MFSKERVTLTDNDDKEIIIDGTYEWYDNETTEAGTAVYGSEVFNIDKITKDGIDITDSFTAEQYQELSIRCLENME